MSKRLFLIAVLVLTVGFFTSAFASAEGLQQPLFDQTAPLTRAEAVALLVNAHPNGLNRVRWFAAHMPPMPLFKDMEQTEWYAPYVEAAFEAGLIDGDAEDPFFRPQDVLTEEEAISLSIRYKEMTNPSEDAYLVIPTDQGNQLNKMVSEAQANGITLPFPIRPGQEIGRVAFYEMIGSAGIENPQGITIARIPVTTTFTTVATIQPIQPVSQPAVIPQNPLTGQVITLPETGDASDDANNANSNSYFAISMPTLGVNDLLISHPTDLTHNGLLAPLKTGVGHLFSYPGQNGKILIYGHSSSYPWDSSEFTKIFRQINKLQVGERVYVNYHGTLYTYEVTHKQAVDAKDTSAYAQEGKEELILYTCWPPDSVKQRYLVHAKLVETVVQK